jgi:hypothetical protein
MAPLAKACLAVIPAYTAWIDLDLIACDRFLGMLSGYLSDATVWARPGRSSALSAFRSQSGLYSAFWVGAQGASLPKTTVSGPGVHDSDISSVGLVG